MHISRSRLTIIIGTMALLVLAAVAWFVVLSPRLSRAAELSVGADQLAAQNLALSSQCWYVLKAGIAEPEEVPQECGVMVAHLEVPAVRGAAGPALEVLRPAPRRPHRMAFATWMALARASAEPPSDDSPQDLF